MRNYYKVVVSIGILWLVAVAGFVVVTGLSGGEDPGRATDIIRLNELVNDAGDNW